MTRKLVFPFIVVTLGFVAICTPMFAHHVAPHSARNEVWPDS